MIKMQIPTKRNYKKEPNRNFGAEKHNNWNEKLTRRVQQIIWSGRGKNPQRWRQENLNYPVWGTEIKRMKKSE